MDNVVPFINATDPDIVALQEVYDGKGKNLETRFRTMDVLKQKLSQFPDSIFGRTLTDTEANNAAWGNAIFSKFPIKNSRNILFMNAPEKFPFGKSKDFHNVAQGMIEAELLINSKSVHVYSWHGVWDTHGGDSPQRDRMLEVILREVSSNKNVILAGDTNLNPTTRFVKKLKEELNLKSVFGNSLKSTFNMKHKNAEKTGYATAAVDMIFATKDLKVISKEMPKVDVSDHYPLTAVFEI